MCIERPLGKEFNQTKTINKQNSDMITRLENTKSVVGPFFLSNKFSFKNNNSKRSKQNNKSKINIANVVSFKSLACVSKYKNNNLKKLNVFKRLSTKFDESER